MNSMVHLLVHGQLLMFLPYNGELGLERGRRVCFKEGDGGRELDLYR